MILSTAKKHEKMRVHLKLLRGVLSFRFFYATYFHLLNRQEEFNSLGVHLSKKTLKKYWKRVKGYTFFFWWREDCSDLGSNHNSWKGVHILHIIPTILMSGRRHKNLNLLSFETQSSLNFILKHIEIGWLGACI